jgi:ribonuclease HI
MSAGSENHEAADAELPLVHLFTDGACSGNPGPGGWAYILRHVSTGKEKEAAGAEAHTTNNRMELQAVIEGLAALKRPCRVVLFLDSQYVQQGLESWMAGWKRNGWKRREKGQLKPVKNDDLWKQLDELIQIHDMTYTHVAGHSGHTENDRCDELAVQAYRDLRR